MGVLGFLAPQNFSGTTIHRPRHLRATGSVRGARLVLAFVLPLLTIAIGLVSPPRTGFAADLGRDTASRAVSDRELAAKATDSECWGELVRPVYVPETGHHIDEPFLSAWQRYDLSILGYPVSEVLEEDGLTVQYFERVRMELHPEYAGTPHEVLFTLIGHWVAGAQDAPAFAPQPGESQARDREAIYYPETRHYLTAPFADFWKSHGGLAVFGYPLSEVFEEDGWLVQYFERARFEHHPEFAGTRYEIQLGHLGRAYAEAHAIDQAAVPMHAGAVDWHDRIEARSLRIPTLMYHQFGSPASRYRVTYADFEQQLLWLLDNGYTPITIGEAYAAVFAGGPIPEKPVVITLDDGPASQWTAAEILDRYGLRATFFVMPNGGLTPAQLRDLAARGHEIASHTLSHPFLTGLSYEQLRHEIRGGKAALEEMVGTRVDYFAYPGGDWDQRVISVVQEAGYCGAVHAWDGKRWTPDKRWIEPRVEIAGTLSLEAFARLVTSP